MRGRHADEHGVHLRNFVKARRGAQPALSHQAGESFAGHIEYMADALVDACHSIGTHVDATDPGPTFANSTASGKPTYPRPMTPMRARLVL